MYSLVDYIPIPEEYQGLSPANLMILDGICKSCLAMIEPLMPFKTGYLRSQLGYELQEDQVVIFIEDCDYAVYLEEDIAKTAGFWSNAVAIFETTFLGSLYNDLDAISAAYEEAMLMIKSLPYGEVYKAKLATGEAKYINMGYVGG